MGGAIIAMMLMQQNQRRMDEQRRRRRRQEEEERRRRKKKQEEEEQRRIMEHRKNSPVIYNEESWQKDRCVKAISMQPSVQKLVSVIEEERSLIIQQEEKKCDEKIIETGYEYEQLRRELESIIDSLRKTGITIEGSQYELHKLSSEQVSIAKPKQTTETFGNQFTIQNGESLTLNPDILSREKYYESRYQEMNPEELEQEFKKATAKLKKYQKFGKYLGFLLNTTKYLELKGETEKLTEKHEQCELRKAEMESYQSLSVDQLKMIKEYFQKLEQLKSVSSRIRRLFQEKENISSESNETIYESSLKAAMAKKENAELMDQVHTYISKVEANDEETMKEAYELVKGEYPIRISRRFLYDLIIANMRGYTKEDPKQKIHS